MPPQTSADDPRSPYAVIPRLFPDSIIVCVGTGPSLCAADLRELYHDQRAVVIAVNDAYRVVAADVLYAADVRWWQWHVNVPDYDMPRLKYVADAAALEYRRALIPIHVTKRDGLETKPIGVSSGGHSGYQALNLAVHFGARRIILLGYDMQSAVDDPLRHHAHALGEHPDQSHPTYASRIGVYETIVQPLIDLQIDVINASRASAITAFRRLPLHAALAEPLTV